VHGCAPEQPSTAGESHWGQILPIGSLRDASPAIQSPLSEQIQIDPPRRGAVFAGVCGRVPCYPRSATAFLLQDFFSGVTIAIVRIYTAAETPLSATMAFPGGDPLSGETDTRFSEKAWKRRLNSQVAALLIAAVCLLLITTPLVRSQTVDEMANPKEAAKKCRGGELNRMKTSFQYLYHDISRVFSTGGMIRPCFISVQASGYVSANSIIPAARTRP
jgi:hypothetical protein